MGLGLAHLGLLGLAWAASGSRVPAGLVLTLVYIVVLLTGPWQGRSRRFWPSLGCWLANLTAAAPTFVLRGRWAIAFPVVVALVLLIALTQVNPDWGPDPPNAIVVTTLAIMLATRIGVSFLFDFAEQADAAASAAEDELTGGSRGTHREQHCRRGCACLARHRHQHLGGHRQRGPAITDTEAAPRSLLRRRGDGRVVVGCRGRLPQIQHRASERCLPATLASGPDWSR
ncbi:hypothetical protein [Aeromicrobium sp. UC242_57]|uniref:hypothetical protein n=1 Tax=Aeromicrobium sp. UC242_57 TaxID=3374624 RepID=UPI0037988C53